MNLTVSDLSLGEVNEEGVPYIMITLKDRKYTREVDGQRYALYELSDEKCACAYAHLKEWMDTYKRMLNRNFIPSDVVFPHCNESVTEVFFGEKMVPSTFMKTVNSGASACDIMPVNAAGEALGKFTAHCFRRGGAQHRFVTGKSRLPLDVVKWWGGWGASDDFNTIIRYLLEETSLYERNYKHYLFTKGSDARMFNCNVTSFEDIGREMGTFQWTVLQKLSHFEQSSLANRLLVSQQMDTSLNALKGEIGDTLTKFKSEVMLEIKGDNSDPDAEQVESMSGINATQEVRDGGWTHVPSCKTWREVLVHWKVGCREKNLLCSLNDWSMEARNVSSKIRSSYSDRKIIAEEHERLGEESFVEKYSPDDITLYELKKVIRSSTRPSKN